MNNTEAYRLVLDCAVRFSLGYSITQATPEAHRKLKSAIKKITPRVARMEARLAKVRAKRRTSTDRPKCCQ